MHREQTETENQENKQIHRLGSSSVFTIAEGKILWKVGEWDKGDYVQTERLKESGGDWDHWSSSFSRDRERAPRIGIY